MRLWYGPYQFPENTVRIAARMEATHDDSGQTVSRRWTWTVRGTLHASTQAEVIAQQRLLEQALAQPNQNLVFRGDSGQVAMSLASAAAIGGVRITSLTYPEGIDGFEFVGGRTFEFTAEARYGGTETTAGGVQLLSFTETVEMSGGGPVIGFARPLNSEPRAVTLYTHSLYEATQSGQAQCLLGYWPPPGPTLGAPIELPRISRTCDGSNYTTAWSYRYQGPRPFIGLPTRVV